MKFLSLFFILFFVFPKKLSFLDFRILTEELKIQINPSSPAYIALKEVQRLSQTQRKKTLDTFEGFKEEDQFKEDLFKKEERKLKEERKFPLEKSHSNSLQNKKLAQTLIELLTRLQEKKAKIEGKDKKREETEKKISKNKKLQLINTRLVSADSFLENQDIQEAYIRFPFLDSLSFDKKIDKVKIHSNSNFIVETHSPHHRTSLFMNSQDPSLNGSHTKTIPLFPEKYIQALSDALNLEGRDEDISKSPLLFGKVLDSNGKPLSGAQVEIDDPGAVPIYFSGFIPDPKRKETSSNGKFVFLNPEKGVKGVRFLYNDAYSMAQSIPVKLNYVSTVRLVRGKERSFQFHPYDAFNGAFPSPLVDLKVFGQNEVMTLKESEENTFNLNIGESPFSLYMDPGPSYALAHYSFHLNPRHLSEEISLSLPAFSIQWLETILQKGDSPYDPEKPILLVLLEKGPKNISFEFNNLRLLKFPRIYFDQEGNHWHRSSFSHQEKEENPNTSRQSVPLGLLLYNIEINEVLTELNIPLKKSFKNSKSSESSPIVYSHLMAPDPDPGVINVLLIDGEI